MLLIWKDFQGVYPRRSERLLPPNAAKLADNCKLWSGEIRAWKEVSEIATPFNGSNTLTIFLYRDSGADYWFNWPALVNVVKEYQAGDVLNRIYFTGDGLPKKTGTHSDTAKTTALAIPAGGGGELPADDLHMGVQAPGAAAGVAIQAAGAGTPEDRVYVYTFVTDWGEEGSVSGIAEIACNDDATIRVTRKPDTFDFVDADVSLANDTIGEVAHGLKRADVIQLTTTATLPSGLALATDYYVIVVDVDTFKLAETQADAIAGTAIDLTALNTGTHTLTWQTPDPEYNIIAWRIYRTNTSSTATDYQFVAEVTIGTAFYDDAITAANLGEVISSLDYDEPPDDLTGLVKMPNGMLAGFSPSRKEVCFSEPYVPYAWPSGYRKTVVDTPVAAAVAGNILIIATEDQPQLFIGNHPSEISEDSLETQQACKSAASMVQGRFGAGWASPEGFYVYRPGRGDVETREYFTVDEWRDLNPATMVCAVYDGRLHAIHTPTGGLNRILVLDPSEPKAAVSYIAKDAKALHYSSDNDALYMLIDGKVWQWDTQTAQLLEFTYRTGKEPVPRPTNMGFLQVKGIFLASIPAGWASQAAYDANRQAVLDAMQTAVLLADAERIPSALGAAAFGGHAFAGDDWYDVPEATSGGLTANIYGNGVLRATVTITDEEPVSLPPDDLDHEFEVELIGYETVEEILLANSIEDLKRA